MAEVVHVFDEPIVFNGTRYSVQVAGRPNGHVWEGWIEFAAADGSDVRRTPRETTQADRQALMYWATGLSGTYLEGAFERTLPLPARPTTPPMPAARFDSPAPPAHDDPTASRHAVLDPFSVAARGEQLLRQELGALADWHLRNIVRAYELAGDDVDVDAMTHPALVELIVNAVQNT